MGQGGRGGHSDPGPRRGQLLEDHPAPIRELRRLVHLHRAYRRMNHGDELMGEGTTGFITQITLQVRPLEQETVIGALLADVSGLATALREVVKGQLPL